MTDRDRLFILIQQSPAWKWFSNDNEMYKFADYLLENGVVLQEVKRHTEEE